MKLIVAASFDGLDHTTRAWRVLEHLEQQGHTVAVAGSGRGFGVVTERFERTFSVSYRRAPTIQEQEDLDWQVNRLLYERLQQFQPQAMILDGEKFSARLAQSLQIPIISIDHEHLFQHARLDLHLPQPQRELLSARKEQLKQRRIRAARYLLPLFFEPTISSEYALSTGAAVRPALDTLTPSHDGPFVAYTWPHILSEIDLFSGAEIPISAHVPLRKHRTELEHVKWEKEIQGSGGNLRRRRKETLPKELDEDELAQQLPPNTRGITYEVAEPDSWLADLARAPGVLMDGELTAITEAITLQTPMLLIPHPRRFDQWCFSQYVEKMGFGEAHPKLTRTILNGFLERLDRYKENLQAYTPPGPSLLHAIDQEIARFDSVRPTISRPASSRSESPRQGSGRSDSRQGSGRAGSGRSDSPRSDSRSDSRQDSSRSDSSRSDSRSGSTRSDSSRSGSTRSDSSRSDSSRQSSGRTGTGRSDSSRSDSGRSDSGRSGSSRSGSTRSDSSRSGSTRSDSSRSGSTRSDSSRSGASRSGPARSGPARSSGNTRSGTTGSGPSRPSSTRPKPKSS